MTQKQRAAVTGRNASKTRTIHGGPSAETPRCPALHGAAPGLRAVFPRTGEPGAGLGHRWATIPAAARRSARALLLLVTTRRGKAPSHRPHRSFPSAQRSPSTKAATSRGAGGGAAGGGPTPRGVATLREQGHAAGWWAGPQPGAWPHSRGGARSRGGVTLRGGAGPEPADPGRRPRTWARPWLSRLPLKRKERRRGGARVPGVLPLGL